MLTRTRFIATGWVLLGAALLVLIAYDLVKLGNQAFDSVGLLVGMAAATAFAICCAVLGISLLRGHKVRMLGQSMACLLALGAVLYLSVNAFMFLRLQLLINAAATFVGIAALWFCWATFRVSRT